MSNGTSTTTTTPAPAPKEDFPEAVTQLAETGAVPEGYSYNPYRQPTMRQVDAEGEEITGTPTSTTTPAP